MSKTTSRGRRAVERVQTGVRIEKRMLKTLKALAEYLDTTLGDLLESIVLHAFEGEQPFDAEVRERIEQLREVYGLEADVASTPPLQASIRRTA